MRRFTRTARTPFGPRAATKESMTRTLHPVFDAVSTLLRAPRWPRVTWLVVAGAASLTFLPTGAHARNVEPGAVSLSAQLGPSVRLDDALSGARTYALIAGQLDYAFDKTLSLLADAGVGLGSGTPVRLHLGGRVRLSDLGVPITPFIQGQLGVGWLFDVLGADLTYFGIRVGTGADYMFTERWGVGFVLALDLGGTTAQRAAFFGTVDALASVTYSL